MEIRQSAGKSYAYLMGVYLGDGSIRQERDRHVFRMNTIDADFAKAVGQAFENLTDEVVWISKPQTDKRFSKSSEFYSVRCGSDKICKEFIAVTNLKQIIPDSIKQGSIEEKKAFLAGVMDSEGFVARQTRSDYKLTNRTYYMGYKSCDVWVNDLIEIMESVGLKIGKVSQEQPRKVGYKTPTRFHIKMQSWVDSGMKFNIARKQSRVDEWASAGAYENRATYSKRRLTSETICQAPAQG